MDTSKLDTLGLGSSVDLKAKSEKPQATLPVPEEIKAQEVCSVGELKNQATPSEDANPTELAIPFDPLAFNMDDLLNGVEARYPTIKFPQGTTTVFMVDGVALTELKGTILHHHRTNAYYKVPFADKKPEDEKAPDCASQDGETGIERITGNEIECETCPLNQFVDGHKACTNRIRVYFCPAGQSMPYILDVPPTSLNAYQSFLNAFIGRRKNPFQFQATVTLFLGKSSGGAEFCKAKFEIGPEHERDAAIDFYSQKMAIKQLLSNG